MSRNEKLEDSLRKVGVKGGQTILDFGCGDGKYSIPAARIVGDEGRLYALDRSKEKLEKMDRKRKTEKIGNIETINMEFTSEIPLPNREMDVTLLYDIFWYFPWGNGKLPKLLGEVYRVSKENALISVYPEHIDRERLREIEESIKIIKQVIERMPSGKLDPVKPEASYKIPEGETFVRNELARGEGVIHLVGDGSENPYRCKIRGPSFLHQIPVLEHLLEGAQIADVPAIYWSLNPCPADMDR